MSDIPLGSLTYPQLLDAAMTLRAELSSEIQRRKDAEKSFNGLLIQLDDKRAELDKARLLVQRLDSENTQYCGKLADCKRELDKAQHERDEWREHAALTDKEILQLSDWLISNAEFDPKTGLIDHCAKLKERVRDLIAAEGEVGDLREQLTLAREELAAEKKAHEASKLRTIVRHIEMICEECGHTKTEDGCAFCIKTFLADNPLTCKSCGVSGPANEMLEHECVANPATKEAK